MVIMVMNGYDNDNIAEGNRRPVVFSPAGVNNMLYP